MSNLKFKRSAALGTLTKKANKATELLKDPETTIEQSERLIAEITAALSKFESANDTYLDTLKSEEECEDLVNTFVDVEERACDYIRSLQVLRDQLRTEDSDDTQIHDDKANSPPMKPEQFDQASPTAQNTDAKSATLPVNDDDVACQYDTSRKLGFALDQPLPKVPIDAWIDELDESKETKIAASTDMSSLTQNDIIIRALFQRDEPTIELVNFDGQPLEWPRFVQTFYEAVHTLPFLTDTKRITILQNHLTGRAKQLTVGLGYHGRSYARALKDLKTNFGHRSVVARAYLEQITRGPVIPNRDRKALQTFQIAIRDCLFTLGQMCYDSDIGSTETISSAIRRLPVPMRDRWAEKCRVIRQRHEPTLYDLESWLSERVSAMFDPLLPEEDVHEPSIHHESKNRRHDKQGNSGGQKTASYKSGVKQNPQLPITKQTPAPAGRPAPKKQPDVEQYSANTCPLCKDSHRLYRCREFQSMSPQKKIDTVVHYKLCVNCLVPGHRVASCLSETRCRIENCGKAHHSSVHAMPNLKAAKPAENRSPGNADQNNDGSRNRSFSAKTSIQDLSKYNVFLQILPVRIHGPDGRSLNTYALLDSACQSSFIKKDIARKLSLSGPTQSLDITTLLDTDSIVAELVSFRVTSIDNSESFNIPWAWTLEELHTPSQQLRGPTKKLQHIADLGLDDIKPDDVGIVIGANQPEAILATEVRRGPPGKPVAVKTPLGWTIMGVADPSNRSSRIALSTNVCCHEDLLHQTVEQFFKTESIGAVFKGTPSLSIEDQKALKTLDEKTRLVGDRYEVPMLWKEDGYRFTDNYFAVMKRFETLRTKFRADPTLYARYKEVIDTLLINGYASRMSPDEVKQRTPKTRYLPHFPVFNPNKPAKLRVVKDAAWKCKGVSLNDTLVTGPDLLNSLVGILLRFRRGMVAIAGDIEAMFHRVLVRDEDKDCLRFLWQEDVDATVPEVYRMNVHIFGAKCSPTCAEYALQRTANDNVALFSEAAVKTALRDFYVDDLITSLPSADGAVKLAKELIALCRKGGFRLTKWTSNSREVLAALPPAELASKDFNLELENLPVERVLGMQWDTEADNLVFRTVMKEAPLTKRGALTIAASVYDPLGLQAPFTLRAKLLIQELWRLKVGWDDPMPEPLLGIWLRWLADLPNIAAFRLPRCYSTFLHDAKRIEVHTFADASNRAMGAVSYLRVINANNEIQCSFLKANTKCATLKPLGPPRLETQACVVGVRQHNLIRTELDVTIARSVFWSDSMTALQYIRNETRRFHTYVANRIHEIHESSEPEMWHHCPGTLNPADDCSRGLSASDITPDHRFLRGPDFLWRDEKEWPEVVKIHPLNDDDEDVRPDTIMVFSTETAPKQIESAHLFDPRRYSRLSSLTRPTAWFLRFIFNVKTKSYNRTVKRHNKGKRGDARKSYHKYRQGPLSPSEIQQATLHWIKQAQADVFKPELIALRSGKPCKTSSDLIRLCPFTDDDDALKVGGRIDKAKVPYDARHQYILPQKHHVTLLLVYDAHEKTAHAGQEHVMARLREKYWIIKARVVVRKVTQSCVICRRRRAQPLLPAMAELPAYRLEHNVPAFTNSGVDYFGPMLVKIRRAQAKRWGCLFTCLVTRAIHIELASSLDTDAFIMALRRFSSRRGCPRTITSDNGTNFRGASKELKQAVAAMNHDEIAERASSHNIEWYFNPSAGPHFGGVWERLVRSVKTTLQVIIGSDVSNYEDVLHTALVEVECIVNSRPLTATSDSPDDFNALTPNHFLIGRPYPDVPPDVPAHEHKSVRKRWRHAQTLAEHYWWRWQKEYVPTLTIRRKWHKPARNLAENDLVIIADEQTPRGRWCLGRVTRPLPGKDGVVRTAEVKTPTTTVIRPAVKLCLLEAADETE